VLIFPSLDAAHVTCESICVPATRCRSTRFRSGRPSPPGCRRWRTGLVCQHQRQRGELLHAGREADDIATRSSCSPIRISCSATMSRNALRSARASRWCGYN